MRSSFPDEYRRGLGGFPAPPPFRFLLCVVFMVMSRRFFLPGAQQLFQLPIETPRSFSVFFFAMPEEAIIIQYEAQIQVCAVVSCCPAGQAK